MTATDGLTAEEEAIKAQLVEYIARSPRDLITVGSALARCLEMATKADELVLLYGSDRARASSEVTRLLVRARDAFERLEAVIEVVRAAADESPGPASGG